MNMQAILAQAQKMQRDVAKKQEEINDMKFTGKSEWVTVEFNGKRELLSTKINETAHPEDIETLEDMITIAINDALKQVNKVVEEKLGAFNQAMPGLF